MFDITGLLGVIGKKEDTEELQSMYELLRHRGSQMHLKAPRDNCRLAVLGGDEASNGGKTPIALDGSIILGDGETVLRGESGEAKLYHLLKEKGPAILQNIEGEFALAAMLPEGLLIARDPLGVKPLYYLQDNGTSYLASEMKALLPLAKEGEIHQVPPGCYYDSNNEWVPYYRYPVAEDGETLTLEKAMKALRSQMFQAVREKAAGVNGLGVYLSGGLDSSVIACLAAELSDKPIVTFTVGVEGSEDLHYARRVAEQIGSEHHEYIYDREEILTVLPQVIYHLESFDSAYVRSSIPNYIAARQARAAGREVMFTGEGSDEIFAGYSYLKELAGVDKINEELEGFLRSMSNTGLQRVDRMNSAFGLECRLPFLKPTLVKLVTGFPLEWKLKGEGSEAVDKWILRRAFEKDLGYEVAWRGKQQFDQGSGSAEMLEQVAEKEIDEITFQEESSAAPVPVRSKEELYYYRIFRNYFPEKVLSLVGRWCRID